MERSLTRTLLIWATIIASIFYVVPTIGWMSISKDARKDRLERWKNEDTQRAKEHPGDFQKFIYAAKRWAEFDRSRVINLGLDLQGGIQMVVSFDWHQLPEERIKAYKDKGYSDADIEKEVQQVVLQQITRRVNDFEAKEPVIQALGTNQVQIQLPGEQDTARAVELIKKTAQLNFQVVASSDETVPVFTKLKNMDPESFNAFIEKPVPGAEGFRVRAENLQRVKDMIDAAVKKGGIIPEDKQLLFSQPPKPFEEQVYKLYLVDKTPLATGEGLQSAGANPDQMNPPYWQIHFQNNNEAAAKFGEATQANINRPMAIVLDNLVVSAPTIRDRISNSGQITGSFTGEEARDLAIALNSGSMVVPVKEEYTNTVGPELGAESISNGVNSSIGGMLIVAAFMIVYYSYGGIIAVLSQILNALFVIALMAYFNMTLTLPGIAGLILTIGMAVDANVLVFERLREELRAGHMLKHSIENGFNRASVTILDANATHLISALVLFQFGSGSIQGFAVTLSIGVITSVFCCLVISRAMFDFAFHHNLFTRIPMLHIIPNNMNIHFMNLKVPALVISSCIVLAGLGATALRGGDIYGVEFSQGTNVNLSIRSENPITADTVRDSLVAAGFGNPIVQAANSADGTGNSYLIRISEQEMNAVREKAPNLTLRETVTNALAQLSNSKNADGVVIKSEQTIGPSVGARLRWDAIKSIIYANIFIMMYLAFRFELKFAVGALVATLHDVFITMGIYLAFGGEISLNVVAAILTVIGYSLNDTIVIFDRMRENAKIHRGKGLDFIEIINMSVNETMSRTVLTSGATGLVVAILCIFGGESLRDFAMPMLIGIIAGTYSTIFIASPVAYYWQEYVDKRRSKVEDTRPPRGGRQNPPSPKNPPRKRETAAT